MSTRARRFTVRAAAVALTTGLLVVAVLGGEALVTTRRSFLSADSAPRVEGSFGATGAEIRLTMVGDSTAAGVGASDTEGTVGGQLASALADDSSRVQLSSVAVSGSRAADLDAQVTQALRRPPDVAVILIGANDSTHATGLPSVRRDVAAAIRRLRAGGVSAVLGACPDMGAARAFPQPLRLVVAWQGRRVAAAELRAGRDAGAEVVDIGRETGPAMRADASTLASDEFHPSDRGYSLWAKALLPAVREAVRRQTAPG